MEYRIVLALLAFVATIQDVRGINSKNIEHLNRHAGSVDCFEAYENCRKIPGCQAALRMLKKKCKIHRGRCSSDSDYKVCGDVRDQLFMYGFPKEVCRCEKSLFRCFKLFNNIYANPCFDEPQKAVEQTSDGDTLPKQEIVATSTSTENTTETISAPQNESVDSGSLRVDEKGPLVESDRTKTEAKSKSEKTTTIKPLTQSRNRHHHLHHRPSPTPTEEIIFGDEGFAKPPPRRGYSQRKYKPARREPQTSDDSHELSYEENEVFTAPMSEWTTGALENEESMTPPIKRSNYLPEQEVEWEMTTDTKYRLISIGIGSVFVLVILVTMLYFAWIRIRKVPFRYKHGKVVAKNNETGP